MTAKNLFSNTKVLKNPVIRISLLILSFFILIGEGTRYILWQIIALPMRFILKIFSLIELAYNELKKSIKSIKIPQIQSPKFTFPHIHIKIPLPQYIRKGKAKKEKKVIKKENKIKLVFLLNYGIFYWGFL